MTVSQWLDQNAQGFKHLSAAEQAAIAQFSLLWSLFEKEVLDGYAGVGSIELIVQKWDANGLLTAEIFAHQLAYFRNRYVANGNFNYRFPHLHLERSGAPPVVSDVLCERSNSLPDIATAVLIIVFRYRNNFFHGEKWTYELREQDQNFVHANSVLMRAIELNRRLPRETPSEM